ncbi:hypothetical protein MPDQ_006652 [Monascus purpureus]|uniref:Cytochrome c oxidase assembly protein cox18, mitochondrial n=1 Tax=Monascus purpureus TaxID=5098 RepID=A0A507R4N7_MONPU|nr:hypothetical protein MPDQ_006652 [Monascus purpureus]
MSSLRPLNGLRLSRAFPRPKSTTFQQTRNFHPTRRSQYIVNDIIHLSSDFIHGVHSVTGLPWVCSIPLTAFIVRMVVAFPLQIYSRIHAQRERDLSPLVQSWHKYFVDRIRDQNQRSQTPLSPREASSMVKKELFTVQRLLRKEFRVSPFSRPANFMQLPVWISLMESLRAMCGSSQGLVPWLLSFFSLTRSASDYVPPAIEPTLASEGGLWFPDLLAGDPTGLLPILMTGTILLNIRTGWHVAPISELANLPRNAMIREGFFRVIRLFVQVLAVHIGLSAYFQEMPCALMVYWISSTNVATLQTFLLEKHIFSNRQRKPWNRMYIALRGKGEPKGHLFPKLPKPWSS